MLPELLFILLVVSSVGASPVAVLEEELDGGSKAAVAVIHEEDDAWGSVVFRQRFAFDPVVITFLFQNMKVSVLLRHLAQPIPHAVRVFGSEVIKGQLRTAAGSSGQRL